MAGLWWAFGLLSGVCAGFPRGRSMLPVSLGAGLDMLFDDSKTSLEPLVPDTTFSDRPTAGIRRSISERGPGESGVRAAESDAVDSAELSAGANTADPAVRSAILAAYDVAGHPGPTDL